MEQIIVEATPRDTRGKNAARRMRCAGQIPAVLYGGSGEPQAVAVNTKQVAGILRSESGHNTIFTVKLNGSEHKAILKDWQVDPAKGSLLHEDIMSIVYDMSLCNIMRLHTYGYT